MRGLAASIKRSLNAERLAASAKPPALPRSPKRSSSVQVIDVDARPEADLSRPDLATGRPYEHEPLPKVEPEPQPVDPEPVIEVDDSPQTVLPVPFSEGSMPQQETRHTPDGRVTPTSHDFVPFSTLAGAVSFDNITNSAPAQAVRTPEDAAMITQPTSLCTQVPFAESPFDPLSFPHRTPTPPLAATITPVHDEDEVEKAEATPSSLLHEEDIDLQLQLPPSESEDNLEMDVVSGEDHVQTHSSAAPLSEHTTPFKPQDNNNNSLTQHADVFVRRTGLLDSPTGEIVRPSIGESGVDAGPASGAGSPLREPEELPRMPTEMSPKGVLSPGSAETSGRGSLPNVPRKYRGKREFYIAVPPPSEWVLRAKHREAARKARLSGKLGGGS
jgi:hypothetical protein